MDKKNLDKFITEVLAIEAEEAKEAGALGYMARALVQATMPHRATEANEFTRSNGAFTLSILAPAKIGLPYGSIPRLLIAWLTTEAVRTKERTLCLGNTLSAFMHELGLTPTGGRWGSISYLKKQSKRLFTSSISCSYKTSIKEGESGFRIADTHELWWTPKSPEQTTLFNSHVILSELFFNEIINHPIPIDLRALKALKRSPLAIDIYCWLTFRMSYLKKNSVIPWGVLKLQFGADYANTEQGKRDFKRAFLRELRKVTTVHGKARVDTDKKSLILMPGKPHIPLL
ncbi:MAG: replication protein RepA [Bacillota bacterium]|nr:replication protein RepA [Bacillota bacterium]